MSYQRHLYPKFHKCYCFDFYCQFEIYDLNYDLTLYAKFGVYSSGKQSSKIWADDLSGCGMDVKFKILRTQNE